MKEYNLELLSVNTVNQAIVQKERSTELVLTFQEKQDWDTKIAFLQYLDSNLQSIGIESYSITQTSLKQVFIQVAEQTYAQEAQKAIKPLTSYDRCEKNEFCWQTWNLAIKRFTIFRRSLKTLMLELFIPLLLIIAGFTISKINVFHGSEQKELSSGLINRKQRILVNKDTIVQERDYDRRRWLYTPPLAPEGDQSVPTPWMEQFAKSDVNEVLTPQQFMDAMPEGVFEPIY